MSNLSASGRGRKHDEEAGIILEEHVVGADGRDGDIRGLVGVAYAVYPATKGGAYIGAAIEASAMGFGGTLRVLVGFDAEGNILDYSLLSHAETPGLGSKADSWFKKGGKGDITGMNPGRAPLVVDKDGGQVDAITASTITTRAFLSAVNAAYAAYAGQNTADGTTGASQQVEP